MSRKVADWIDGFLELTDITEPPLNYRRWTAISTIAAALQRKTRLEWGDLVFYPNMYIVLVGPPGRTRKGTAMSYGKSFLNELQIPMSAEAVTRESLIRRAASSTAVIINPETGTQEYHSSITIFSPELTVFLGHNNFQLMSDLTDWFDCAKTWTYETKTQGTDEILGVWVNLFGATTPDLIRTALPLDAIGSGLTSRIIFIFEPNKGKCAPVPFLGEKERQLKADLIHDLHEIHALQGQFKFTQPYVDLWIDWYSAQDDNPPFIDKRFAGYFERRALHVRKLSMICCASRTNSMVLERQDFERAVTFLEHAERKMTMAFTGVGKNTNNDVMSAMMSEIALRQKTTVRELMEVFYIDIDHHTLENMLRTLEMIKYIKITPRGKFSDHVIEYRGESEAALSEAIKACLEDGGQ